MAIINNLQAKAIKPDDKPIAHGAVTGLTLVPSKIKVLRGSVGKGKLTDRDRVNW